MSERTHEQSSIPAATAHRAVAERPRTADDSHRVDPERLQKVFRHRAERLANADRRLFRNTAGERSENTQGLLLCSLAGETYGIPLAVVGQVLPCTNPTPLPTAGPELLGIMSIRGEIRTIVDLRILLNLPAAPDGQRGYVVVVRTSSAEVGLRVDCLERVASFADSELAPVGEHYASGTGTHLAGVTTDGATVIGPEALLRLCGGQEPASESPLLSDEDCQNEVCRSVGSISAFPADPRPPAPTDPMIQP